VPGGYWARFSRKKKKKAPLEQGSIPYWRFKPKEKGIKRGKKRGTSARKTKKERKENKTLQTMIGSTRREIGGGKKRGTKPTRGPACRETSTPSLLRRGFGPELYQPATWPLKMFLEKKPHREEGSPKTGDGGRDKKKALILNPRGGGGGGEKRRRAYSKPVSRTVRSRSENATSWSIRKKKEGPISTHLAPEPPWGGDNLIFGEREKKGRRQGRQRCSHRGGGKKEENMLAVVEKEGRKRKRGAARTERKKKGIWEPA